MKYQYTNELSKIYHRQRRHYVAEQIVRGATLREVGKEVGITPARARQLLAQTVRLFDKSPFADEYAEDNGERPTLEYQTKGLSKIETPIFPKDLVNYTRRNSEFYLTILKAYKLLDDIQVERIMFMDEAGVEL